MSSAGEGPLGKVIAVSAVETLVHNYEKLSDADKKDAYLKIRDVDSRDVPLPAGGDFPDALRDVFQRAGVQGTEDELGRANGFWSTFRGAPQSVAGLESTSTALAKWWATAIGAGGPLAAMVAAWLGWWQKLWTQSSDTVRLAVVLGVAVVAASLVFSVAIIINADLKGRSSTQSAIYATRSALGEAYIASAHISVPPSQLANLLEVALHVSQNKPITVNQDGVDVGIDAYRRTPTGSVEVHDSAGQKWILLRDWARIQV